MPLCFRAGDHHRRKVAAVLYLFRAIYAEVVGALPLNGGAYNALLNTTSKRMASLAACLTVLSYMATAVISASEAMHYIQSLWHGIPVIPATVALLAVFMVLTIIGITESARVAVAIFITHLTTLTLLLVVGGIFLITNGLDVAVSNFQTPTASLPRALFFGFAAAMLGISGFESSANFVEEQAENVFPRTLRNMWIAVSFFNPAMALLALALVPIPEVEPHKEALLSHMGGIAGGPWFSWLISLDAGLVLSGAVLTSYVGVTGLLRRMTLDRGLPQLFLKTNRRGTNHRIIIVFFLISASVMYITEGDLAKLAGVYTISFLSVMALFGIGNKGPRNRVQSRSLEVLLRNFMVLEQRLYFLAELFVSGTGVFEVLPALGSVFLQRGKVEVFDSLPSLGHSALVAPLNSRKSHTFANFQSRITVSAETPRASAVSSTLSPPKKRSSTTFAFLWSMTDKAWSASSRATRSSLGSTGPWMASFRVTFGAPSPLFKVRLERAKSTKMRRISCAETAKKWPRFCHRTCFESRSRK